MRKFAKLVTDNTVQGFESPIFRTGCVMRKKFKRKDLGCVMRKKFKRKDLGKKVAYLMCPKNCRAVYREYMREHNIPFIERYVNGKFEFILPRKYRPHAWKLNFPE
jgi:hypothetical protein